jgi:prepilin signal peptidase PulO-like enzyme (type II secretory pathway)
LSKGKWIGGGDVKLGFVIGLLLGARDAFIALYAASILGVIFMIVFVASKRITRKSKIPFGPFLIAGALIGRLFGAALWAWYKSKLVV